MKESTYNYKQKLLVVDNAAVFPVNKTLRAVVEEAKANNCPVLLVKDWGIYLMSQTGEMNAKATRRKNPGGMPRVRTLPETQKPTTTAA